MLWSTFRVTVKLKGKENICLTPCHHTYTVSHIINITQQNGTFLTKDGSTLTYNNHPKSIVYIIVYPWYYTFNGFEQIHNEIFSSL